MFVAGGLFVVLLIVALVVPVPYVILSPGPTLNTLGSDPEGKPIITITGKDANQTSGNLNLTTVDVTTQTVTAFQALTGWLKHDRIVVPRSSIYPPGQSVSDVNQADTQQFTDSQNSATAAAFCELGYPQGLGVVGVIAKTGATGVLKPFDQLVTIDGAPADTQAKVSAILAQHKPGDKVAVDIKRSGTPMSFTIALSKSPDNNDALIGVTVGTECFAPFSVSLGLGDQIGGPSAGLMFALGIMDKTGSDNLTAGNFIAGTGEIQSDGKVLPIGGIQLKMIAARRKGATVFLAPADNCSDVKGNIPKGLNVVKVDSLHSAVTDLKDLQQGKAVPHC
jgi:PDZ domain-containing protein